MSEIRELVLRLAVELGQRGEGGSETVERARHLLDFLEGKRDAEVISAARELAKLIA